MRRLKKGLVHVYTGNGKGKTTAAIGLAIRAVGAGLKVYILQFIKNGYYSENRALAGIQNIRLEQYGRGCFIKGKPRAQDKVLASKGLRRCRDIIKDGKYDLVILDEVNISMDLGLVRARDLLAIIKGKPKHVEMVLTGRSCPSIIVSCADIVTDMREVKHPFAKGVLARKGIEC